MNVAIAEQKRYIERRRRGTIRDIASAAKEGALPQLLASRKRLARIYAEDGAVMTARCIETTDVPLIEAAMRKQK